MRTDMWDMRRKIFFDIHWYGNDVSLLIFIGMKDNCNFVKNYKKNQKLQNIKIATCSSSIDLI